MVGSSFARIVGTALAVVLLVVLAVVLVGGGSLADRLLNRVYRDPPYQAGPAAAALHRRQQVVDLHGDVLLWNRDLLQRASYGHVDLPRLQEGNVALQVFGVVTQFPLFVGLDDNSGRPDVITALAWVDRWPAQTRDSRLERALHQAVKLKERVRQSNGALRLITGRDELAQLTADRQGGEPVTGALLALEGAQALEGDPANLEALHEAGFRMIGLAHFFDNEMSGSAHGEDKYGLTPAGRAMVRRMALRGMIVDLAHASHRAFEDVLALAPGPVIVSHGGVRATCDTQRNLSDAQLRAIAAAGGVIGVGLFRYATCGKTLGDTVSAMRHVADLVGVAHVALGSDFDGATSTVFDASGWPLLTEALMAEGFSEPEIAAILGGNALRVLEQALP